MPTISLPDTLLTLAQTVSDGRVLVSYFKPLMFVVPLGAWAWLISKVYDKHAARFFLPRRKWNLMHMSMGMLAVCAAIGLPLAMKGSEIAFWVGWAAMIAVLLVDLVAYPMVANKDERVPERYRLRMSLDSLRQGREEKAKAKLQAKVALTFRQADDKGKFSQTVEAPQPETPEFEVRVAAEKVFIDASIARATQVEIGPMGKDGAYGVTFMVDGVRQAGETMPPQNAMKIMDFYKAAAKLDVNDRRKKQVGMIQVERDVSKTPVQVTSIGAGGGMRVTLLLDPESQVKRKLADLGLLDMQLTELKSLQQEGKGVVLLAAPPDQGRTTSLYTIVRMHDAYTTNVQTLETEPQGTLEGVRQNKFDPQAEGAEFSTTIRSILRRDPDVVAVADLPDANTAKEIARADPERTRVYLSLRAPDTLTAIQAWVKSVGDPKQAAACLHGAIGQRLVRKLCTNCRQPYPPTPDMLKKLQLPEGKIQQLWKKGGQVLIKNKPETCPVCGGAGYYGQEGIYEIYTLGPEEREMIASGNYPGLKASLRKRQQPTIQNVAIKKAVDGVTSVEEVIRMSQGDSPAPTAPPAAGGGAAAPNGAAVKAPPAAAPQAKS